MKWLAIGILIYLTQRGDAGALKCSSKSQDPLCASEKRELSLPSQLSREAECLPGSEWESHCHSCRCSEAGVAQCRKQDSCDLPVYKEPIRCKPHTSFARDCNTCRCLENGHGLCTLMECIDFTIPQPEQDDKSQQNVEKRHTSAILMKSSKAHVITKRGVCKSNSEFQIDCNPCRCAPNGQTYTCTHNECLEGDTMNKEVEVFMETEGSDHVERHSVCKAQDTFYIGCNPCHCNAYGTDYTCTNKPCPLPKDVEIFHELNVNATNSQPNITKRVVCVANRMFIMDCNTCWCNEDGTSFFCTRRVCTPDSTDENNTDDPELAELKLKQVKKECRPNEVFELECNMCRCSADGKSFSCTRRACVESVDKNTTGSRMTRAAQQEPPKACQPGKEFRMDCNKCLCNDEGQDFSCTRIDCAAQGGNGEVDTFSGARSKRETEQVTMQCIPQSVYNRGCNVCRCTSEGLHAVCTLKPCRNPDKEEVALTTDPSFRCTPGDQFKQECNDCTCSADGKNVFCTLRLCDTEIKAI